MLVMGLELKKSSMVISTTDILLYALHIGSSYPTCVQNFRPVALTVFEIQGFKLKNKNDKKKNWRNGLFAISPMLVVQF